MKKRSVIALLLLASMLVGCGNTEKSKVRHNEEETSEVTSETTEETTAETTAEPTPTSEPTEKPTPTPQDINVDDLSMEEIHYLYRAFAEGLHKDNSELKFGFVEISVDGSYVWCLATLDGNGTYAEYASVDGKMTDITKPDHYLDSYVTSFENFMNLPCVTEVNNYTFDEIVESIDDGTYYGNIMAISEDSNYMLVQVGDPVSFTKEEFDKLEIGDVVYHDIYSDEDVYVESIDDYGITLSYDDLWISENTFIDNSNEYMIFSSSANPVTVNNKIAVVKISSDCEIDDTYKMLLNGPDDDSDPEGYAEYLEGLDNPTVLQKTIYWFYATQNWNIPSLGNQWNDFGGLLYPIVIKNGEVTMMSLQWR